MITFPIFVLSKDCGDVHRYDSIYDMQKELEKIDIANHEYEAWSCDGRPLTLTVQQPVWLNVESDSSEKRASLKQVLNEYAIKRGVHDSALSRFDGLSNEEFFKVVDSCNSQTLS